MRAHPAADIFPMMTDDELAKLAEDIKKHGQRFPVVTIVENDEPLILDGRNRFRACEIAKVPVMSSPYGGEDPYSFVVSANLQRRHLSLNERAMLSAEVARLRHGANQHRKKEDGARAPSSPTRAETAGLFDISVDSVKRARAIADEGCPELIEAVRISKVSLKAASKLARMPKEEQRARLESGDIPKDKPSTPPESEPRRMVDRDGKLAKEVRAGVLRVVGAVRELPVDDTRLHAERHDRIRQLSQEGLGPKAISIATGDALSFVQSSLSRFVRKRKGVLDRAIVDVETFAETWSAIASDVDWRWPTATEEDKERLMRALDECARAVRRVISRLNKEAKEKTGT